MRSSDYSPLRGLKAGALGGLVGAAAAALLNLHRYETRVVRWFYIAGIAIIPLLCVGVLIRAKHSDVRWLDVERQGFKQKLGGVIRDAREEGRKALRAADNYRVDTPTEKWERAKVDELLDQLKTAQKKLSNAEKECEQAGPFNTQRVRTAVTAAHKALSKQRAVLEHLERCLEAGVNWTRDEEDQLKKAADEMNEARAEYERILSGDE